MCRFVIYVVFCVLLCALVSSSILQWNVAQSALLLSWQIGHGAGEGGGDEAHSGQRARACSAELLIAQRGAAEPVIQPDKCNMELQSSICKFRLPLAE